MTSRSQFIPRCLLLLVVVVWGCVCTSSATPVGPSCAEPLCFSGTPNRDEAMPVNFTVAFIGDQGLSAQAKQVLNLIKTEGAHMVLHQGDFDYVNNPVAWDTQITDILGDSFPYFASTGNHDFGAGPVQYERYRALIGNRTRKANINTCRGNTSTAQVCSYKGFTFVISDIGVEAVTPQHSQFVRDAFNEYGGVWRACSWHKNQRLMQLGQKVDETGWDIYEACRLEGAIVATGHEHSYSRSFLMSNITAQTVVSNNKSLPMVLDKGQTFVFVNGVGGMPVRPCVNQLEQKPWWGSALCSNSTPVLKQGSLFCKFNLNGVMRNAYCYFKQIDGAIPDSFQLESNLYPATPPKKPSGDDAGLSSTSSRVLIVLVAVAVLVTLIFVYFRRRRLAQQQALNEANATRLTGDAFDVNMRNRGLSSGSGDHSDDADAHMPLSGRPPSSREASRNAPQSGNPDPLGHLAYA